MLWVWLKFEVVWGVSMDCMTVMPTVNWQTSLARAIGGPTDFTNSLLRAVGQPTLFGTRSLFGSA